MSTILFLKYSIYGKSSWYIALRPLFGRCPIFGVSAKRGSTVEGIARSTDKVGDYCLVKKVCSAAT